MGITRRGLIGAGIAGATLIGTGAAFTRTAQADDFSPNGTADRFMDILREKGWDAPELKELTQGLTAPQKDQLKGVLAERVRGYERSTLRTLSSFDRTVHGKGRNLGNVDGDIRRTTIPEFQDIATRFRDVLNNRGNTTLDDAAQEVKGAIPGVLNKIDSIVTGAAPSATRRAEVKTGLNGGPVGMA
jgi:hypothetical protein